MRILAFVLALAFILAPAARAAAPVLTVVISVDQMRADYMTRYAKEYTGGFARLAREGAVYTRARHGHVPTETAVGHAALMTGCFPSQHGVVGNEWWDKKEGRAIYAVEDAERWRGPVNLECPTLGDALKAASPSSRVVSVSGKDRAAILMGGRKADLALWYDRSSGQFVTSGVYGRMPDWVWTWDDTLRIPVPDRDKITSTPRLDAITLELASKAIDETRLGARGVPDLLAVSLSVTDILGHAVGPDAPEMHAQLLALDKLLGAFFDGLDRRFGKNGYALALSSDHGVTPLPEVSSAPGAERFQRKGLEESLENALRAKFGAPKGGAKWVLDLHSPYVYLDLASAETVKGGSAALLALAVDFLSRQAEVAFVYTPADIAAGADGPYAEAFRLSYRPGRSGDLMVLFKRGVILADGPTGTVHGLPYDDDARVPLIFMGAGIAPGRHDEGILATDLAPTLARLLGVDLAPRAPSRVLTEALSEPAPAQAGVHAPVPPKI
jgi:predicted AlkP superfamily pyrophosphatase or phosphodiesterase